MFPLDDDKLVTQTIVYERWHPQRERRTKRRRVTKVVGNTSASRMDLRSKFSFHEGFGSWWPWPSLLYFQRMWVPRLWFWGCGSEGVVSEGVIPRVGFPRVLFSGVWFLRVWFSIVGFRGVDFRRVMFSGVWFPRGGSESTIMVYFRGFYFFLSNERLSCPDDFLGRSLLLVGLLVGFSWYCSIILSSRA